MRRTRSGFTRLVVAALVPVSLLSVASDVAGGQLGALRRKIGEVTKGEEARKEEAAKPGAPSKSAVDTAFEDRNVIELTDAVLDALERTLETEIKLQGEFMKELAALKTPEQYNACKQEAATSPEAQKIIMKLGELGENPTPEQMQNAMAQMAKDNEALVLKRCGTDVNQFNDSWRYKRLQEIRRQAVAAGGYPR